MNEACSEIAHAQNRKYFCDKRGNILKRYFKNVLRNIRSRKLFCSKVFDKFMSEFDIKHIRIATASPQANNQFERVNRIMQPMLTKLVERKDRKHWYKLLSIAEYILNNVPHKSIGDTLSHILFGMDQRSKSRDKLREYLESQLENDKCDLDIIRNHAKDSIYKAQDYNLNYANRSEEGYTNILRAIL